MCRFSVSNSVTLFATLVITEIFIYSLDSFEVKVDLMFPAGSANFLFLNLGLMTKSAASLC